MGSETFSENVAQLFSNVGGYFYSRYKNLELAVDGSNRRVLLCLGLLNVALLIAAVSLGAKCARVKESGFHVSHSAVKQLLTELDYLHSNHSDVIEAEDEAKKALETAVNNHKKIKMQVEKQKSINDDYQKQVETLWTERNGLRTNITAMEGTCGKCIPGWLLLNSSCYFFSYLESATVKKSWHDSRADCVHRGADLVVINNPDEQKFTSDSIKDMKTSTSHWENGFYVGLTDIVTEGKWVWINNVTEQEPRYWMDGEPNNHGRREHCGVIIHSTSNPWKTRYDGGCETVLHWICEMEMK